MPASTDTLGLRVARRRAALGMRQWDLAIKCGCDQVTISKVERGVYLEVKKSLLEALSKHLDLTLEELISGKRPKSARGA